MTSGPHAVGLRGWRALGTLAALLAALGLAGCTPAAPHAAHTSASHPPAARPTPGATDIRPPVTLTIPGVNAWLGYHADSARTGALAASLPHAPATRAWTANLGGAVYGQPVVADGLLIAATETDQVVALNPATGQLAWSASLGTPLTNVDAIAGCGNIDPLGITSTPVIDAATGTVFVVGEVSTGGGAVHHQLEGFSIPTGKVVLSEAVDPSLPPGESPVNLLQRASLALANGRVYIGFGGNFGDCGEYHGWVVGVEESGPPDPVSFEAAPDGQGGAIWMGGGAPAIDANGDLYVGTGNANPDPPAGGPDPLRFTESVVKLSPTLQPLAAFKDQTAGGDEDLGTGNPVLLPDGRLFSVGKTDVGYVLSQSTLAQTAAIHGICGSDPDGGPAYDAATGRIFVPCRGGGIQPVDLATGAVGPLMSGADGSPTLVGSTLWAAQYPDGTLSAYNAQTGALLQTISVGSSVPNFATPAVADGFLYLGTTSGVVAFR
ncbi:PQQ-binding-like beta-propeller repeat protein [Diaminobutyricibacter sp. McL0618]|uniref:outer membrane protein assembly factor BamB family protein n=1 Tax=Leifsonia sp. McL0618 TaxID=3415677 RepID=UPI003CE9F50D